MTDPLAPVRKRIAILGGVVLALMVGLSVFGWVSTSPGQEIPVHWNIAGDVDRYGSRVEAFVPAPVIWALVLGLLLALPSLEPRRRHLEQSRRAYLAGAIGAGGVMLVVHTIVVVASLGIAVGVDRILPVVLGLMLAIVGNYLGKTRSNFFIGVRTPWTLSSEISWRKTHRWAGRVFVLIALLTIACGALPSPGLGILVAGAGMLMATFGLVAYSYLVWRQDPHRRGMQDQ